MEQEHWSRQSYVWSSFREIARDIVAADVDLEGRKLIVMKAKGPGATVGKPGEAVEKIVEAVRSGGVRSLWSL